MTTGQGLGYYRQRRSGTVLHIIADAWQALPHLFAALATPAALLALVLGWWR